MHASTLCSWLRLSDVQRKPDTAVSVGLLVAGQVMRHVVSMCPRIHLWPTGRDRAQSNYNNEQYIANVMSLLESESAQASRHSRGCCCCVSPCLCTPTPPSMIDKFLVFV